MLLKCFLDGESYSLVSYVHKHDDGRTSFPYFFLYVAPQGNYTVSPFTKYKGGTTGNPWLIKGGCNSQCKVECLDFTLIFSDLN
jgi:hypothetical protein